MTQEELMTREELFYVLCRISDDELQDRWELAGRLLGKLTIRKLSDLTSHDPHP
jgi:hypothetical protein